MTRPAFIVNEDIPSADFVFDAFGDSPEELFVNCARASFYAMTDPEKVDASEQLEFEVRGETIEDLLFNFISELVYLKDSETMFFSEFNIEFAEDGKSLKAIVGGERIDYNKHTIKTDVKAATYHDLRIVEEKGRYKARMILDL